MAQPAPVSLSDNFDDNAREPSRWRVGVVATAPSTFDTLVKVWERNGRLEIAPVPKQTGSRYGGYASANQVSLVDGSVQVEIVATPTGGATALFAIVIDANNSYLFRMAGGKLFAEAVVAGKRSITRIDTPTAPRYLRFIHDGRAQVLMWQTSTNGTRWSTVHLATPEVSLSSLTVALSAGTDSAVADPGRAIFDNVVYEGSR